ncbi:MAG: alpha/beta fold hydrolase [Gammaproteobacteria bacterium]
MERIHTISGGGGLDIHVREWGKASGPSILFIHGWSQNHLCWTKQFNSDLIKDFRIVALDLRGHGMSAAPTDVKHYNKTQLWAEDIKSIIDALALEKPVLSGWSYGGLVISDYIRIYGTAQLGAINYVGAAPALNENALGKFIGPGFYENFEDCTNPDLNISISGIIKFLHECFEVPPSKEEFETMVGFNCVVPPIVRANLAARDVDNSDLIPAIDIPVLVSHGNKDCVVLPYSGEFMVEHCRNARGSWYDAIGHAPFFEDAARFNREIATLAREVN